MYFYMNLVRANNKKFSLSFFCRFNVLSCFIHNMLPVVMMGSPDYGLRMRVWYSTWQVTSVLDSKYHKNRDGVEGGSEG